MEEIFGTIGRFVAAIIMYTIPVLTTLSFAQNMDILICFLLLIFSGLDFWFMFFLLQD